MAKYDWNAFRNYVAFLAGEMASGTMHPHHDSELISWYHDAFLPWDHYLNNIVLFYHDSPITRSHFMDPTDRAIKGFYCIIIFRAPWRSFLQDRFFIVFSQWWILIIKHVFTVVSDIFKLGTVWLKGLKWLRNYGTWTTCLHSNRPMWEMIWKIFFSFDFHILREHRRIGGRIFPCHCISVKTLILWGPCWHIYLQSKPSLNCCIAT